jgi:hypothetical protein
MILRLLTAALIIGTSNALTWLASRWYLLDGARCAAAVQAGMQALDVWPTAERDDFLARLETVIREAEERRAMARNSACNSMGGSA